MRAVPATYGEWEATKRNFFLITLTVLPIIPTSLSKLREVVLVVMVEVMVEVAVMVVVVVMKDDGGSGSDGSGRGGRDGGTIAIGNGYDGIGSCAVVMVEVVVMKLGNEVVMNKYMVVMMDDHGGEGSSRRSGSGREVVTKVLSVVMMVMLEGVLLKAMKTEGKIYRLIKILASFMNDKKQIFSFYFITAKRTFLEILSMVTREK